MTRSLLALTCLCLSANALAAEPARQPKIQIAILLDTSSSMDGLINQARQQLWSVVNTFTSAKRDGVRPQLEIALYEYGNDRLAAEGGFIRQVSGLTTNLDLISEKLFALKTSGGDEFCGQVIGKAVDQLAWSNDPHDLKLIYIAGNEPFTQGRVDFHTTVKAAISRGIVVNTIHCGSEHDGIAGKWQEAARLADGNYLTIDQNRAVAQIDAPQDKELAALGQKLNQTYVGYGARGDEAKQRQEKMDQAAAGLSAATVSQRAAAKSSAYYDNSEWDLVDAKKHGKDVRTMAPAALPAPLAAMKPEERDAFVEAKAKERAELQAKITALSAEREKFVQQAQKQQAAQGAASLDEALVDSVKAQGNKRAFSF